MFMQVARQHLKRAFILTIVATSLLIALPHDAGARTKGGAARAGANADIFAQMCRAAGGTAVFTTSIDPSGTVTYLVTCKGGYLGGIGCLFDEDGFASCARTRYAPISDVGILELDDIAPLDEPVAPLIVAETAIDAGLDENRVVDAPANSDVIATPTAEPTPEIVAEDPSEAGGEVVVGPVVDDGAAVEQVDESGLPELEPVVNDPLIDLVDIEDIEPAEVITLL